MIWMNLLYLKYKIILYQKNTIVKYSSKNYEQRDVHNLYGYFMHKASYEALLEKYNNKIRTFILTRNLYRITQTLCDVDWRYKINF